MINLLKETIQCLSKNGKTVNDVVCVINTIINTQQAYDDESQLPYGKFSWDQFKEKAIHFRYNNGFGSLGVDIYLKIIGKNWWLERAEYDGSEWWEYKSMPDIQSMPTIDARIKDMEYYLDSD